MMDFNNFLHLLSALGVLTTIFGFISKRFSDSQKKKLEEILQVVSKGFVDKKEHKAYRRHVEGRLEKLELGVFMRKHPDYEPEVEEGN